MNFWTWWNELTRALPKPALALPAPFASAYAMEVLGCAEREVGHGEHGANNVGPDLDRYRTDLHGRMGPGGAWCSAFVSHCLEQAAQRLSEPCPVQRSHNAKRLFLNACEVGTRVASPAEGDLVCWHRGAAGASTGHIGIVSRVDGNAFWSVQGNKGSYPSKVREYLSELGEANLIGFVRLP